MPSPIADFFYSPLGGKAPLEVTFVNDSKYLGGVDEWDSCTLGNKYFYSPLTLLSDDYALDFSGENAISTTYDSNGFKIESDGVYHPGEVIYKYKDDITVNCNNDFYIEFTISSFDSWHGSLELFFPNTSVPIVNPGIHINTDGGTGVIRGINNAGDVANLANYTLPVKVKFKKVDTVLTLWVNDTIVDTIATTIMGLDSGSHDLRFKISTQNNVSNWYMQVKDIYVINSDMANDCMGISAEYLWDFGDGNTSIEENPVHIYEEDDIYIVSLTVTNEYGSGVLAKSIFIAGDPEPLEDADEIYQEHIAEILKNYDDIPNYCSNQNLRQLINAAIHDAMRHADVIEDSVTARMNITISELYNGLRTMRCQTNFISGLQNDINKPMIRRTVVEPEKQDDIVDSTFDFE